ncbi:hypothetical protein GALMADRAFT_46409, partial [Galerina marginata CBS 339.88]
TSPSFPRAASLAIDFFPRRVGPPDDQTAQRGMNVKKNTDQPFVTRSRSHSKSTDKGKEPIRGPNAEIECSYVLTTNAGKEHYVPHYNGVSSYPSHDKTRPATTDGNINGRSKFRGSLLIAASDALGFKFGRRRPSIRQPPMPIILPDVIEISASHHDEEVEERNRLKQMAAEAIGLGPFMVSPDTPQSYEDSTEEEEPNHTPESLDMQRLGYGHNSGSVPNVMGRSPHGSSLSVTMPSQQPTPGGRFRSGSMLTHRHSNSMTLAPIPQFPSTVGALTSFKQSVGVFPKYYPPSSLRIFALSKNWKNRYLILSSPATLVTRGQGPAVSYLHLFKSSNRDEKELERLEINEDSVVFVSEEEVGGRRHVIKVGGADVGAMKKEYTHEEGGHTMWLLQIPDQAEAQSWITNIKNAILGQRTVRAGLIPAHTLGNNEPRGDMDVMLSIRAQSLVTIPPSTSARSSQALSQINISQGDTNPTYASSISSNSGRSHSASPKPSPSAGAVSTLKGLFNNTVRPRSASRAASIDSERQQDREGNDESFTSMGSNLLNMLRSNTPDTQSIITVPSSPVIRNLPFSGPVGPIDRRIDRKILAERQPIQWASTEPAPMNKDRANKGFSLGAMSLQPPPRKRWMSGAPTASINQDMTPTQSTDPSRRTSLSASVVSADRAETEPPSSGGLLSGFQFGTPEQRPRAPSLQSVSTFASNENGISMERSSLSTKRSSGTRSARRWSRQGILPTRLTPPSEPPPAIPTSQFSATTNPVAVPERVPSPISSQSSQKSTVSGLPTFNKRASGSSVHSFGTSHSMTGSTHSNVNPGPMSVRTPSANRISMPPPRPAPTSALPPAPTEANQDVLKPLATTPPATKTSFRNSVSHRTFRLSMIAAPKPPPSTTLPPRPDEPEYKNHRRSSSGSSNNPNLYPSKLETIPASPIPPSKLVNPFPPPVGPLPPTPPIAPIPGPSAEALPPKRATSIKQRLRIRSAPSAPGGQRPTKPRPLTNMPSAAPPLLTTAMSPPATPIAEKITMFQNDPSFLHMHTPVMQSLPPPQGLPAAPPDDIITSLSPPPRRGSKQLLESDLLVSSQSIVVPPEDKISKVEGPPRHLSLSRPGSALS